MSTPTKPVEDPLSSFTPRVREWFARAFAAPTPAQAQAWPAISAGEHVLLSAPTGSGKTLAAFLWALDRLSADSGSPPGESPNGGMPDCGTAGGGRTLSGAAGGGAAGRAAGGTAASNGTRVVYVSPLKALAYDIERNLRVPLRGIGADDVTVGIRTGDTPQRERAAMARRPPDILITTPESLYLILTSQARAMLCDVEAVIVDEIHAVAHSKRGSHLALTLERLESLVRDSASAAGGLSGTGASGGVASGHRRAIQRIGLSATQRPLAEIGRFLVGPHREVTILDAASPKQLDLRIEVPVESMAEPNGPADPARDPLDPLAGGAPTRASPVSERGIWPAIYPELLRLVRAHNSTIVFVNNRRAAERVALRLNELAAREHAGIQEQAGAREQAGIQGHAGAQGRLGVQERAGSDGGDEDEQAASGGGAGVRVESPGVPPLQEVARAHHGSLAREERAKVEELLKAGELPCLVATSSLELGIDMGAVDLVLQIESPKSVARGLQRVGRAGHGVDQISRGRIFPKFRGDLLECAVVVHRMHEGLIEETVVPRNALDVLAQQIVAIASSSEPAPAGPSKKSRPSRAHDDIAPDAGISVDELHALVTATHSYSELSRELLENVLDMLDGRYPSKEFGELRARIVWDRLAGVVRARKGARQLAVANAGTIPDRGLYTVTLPDGRRVGELDEEMVYEARPGQVFLLGASAWRIEEIGRDRVIVTPAPGAPGAVPFWKGDSVGRPRELGEAIGAFSRWAVDQDAATLERDYDLDERAARNLLAYLREQLAATRVLPSDRTLVLERFRDEIGDWRLCILSPYGRRVHAAWGLALSARIRLHLGFEADVIASDDGIVMHLPDLDSDDADSSGGWESIAELVLLEPDDVEPQIMAELGDSALFGARFRENASRALLIPRAYPGRRTPLWQQRLKAQNLLEVARRYADFPIVLETYRECLRDVLDVPGLEQLLRDLHTREISLVEVETPTASPFASSLLFDYVATYMYEGDAPSAERRAAALSLDRDLLRELLGQEELRELIDPIALARVEDDLQHRSDLMRATGRDGLHDVLRHVGDLDAGEISERVFPGVSSTDLLVELRRERRAVAIRVGGRERFIAADEAGLYRDALGAVPPGGLPDTFLADVPDALRVLVARYARTHGPFTTEELRARYGLDASAVLRELERDGLLVRGELRPDPVAPSGVGSAAQGVGSAPQGVGPVPPADGREWCDVEVLRRLRRASLAALRKEIEPADQSALAAFLPAWQGVDRHSPSGACLDRLREVLVPLQALPLPAAIWERDVLPRRTGAYSQSWLDSLCASGELVWVGAGSIGRSGRVALYFRDDAPLLGPPPAGGAGRGVVEPPSGVEHELLRARLAQGPCFFSDLLAELACPRMGDPPAEALREALWDLVWAGEATNDAWAPLRAPHLSLARGGRPARGETLAGPSLARALTGRSRFAGRRGRTHSQVQGRWSLTASLFAVPGAGGAAAGGGGPAGGAGGGPAGGAGGPAGGAGGRPAGGAGGPAGAGAGPAGAGAGPAGAGAGPAGAVERRRVLAELLLERYGIVTREQILAEGVRGGFAGLYNTFADLETLGVCRRGYFVEGMGGAQFALPGAVERLRAVRVPSSGSSGAEESLGALVLAAADPAQPYGAALPWPKRASGGPRPARVVGAYVVLVADKPALYVERGGRALLTLVGEASSRARGGPLEVDGTASAGSAEAPGGGGGRVACGGGGRVAGGDRAPRVAPPVYAALAALADAVRAGRVPKLALERIDGDPAIGSPLEEVLLELGFHSGPRRLTLSA
jgi:ATP-dependent helicase Lhr and Lhr-like helicase